MDVEQGGPVRGQRLVPGRADLLGVLTVIAPSPRLAANAAKSTVGSVWDSANLGVPCMARSSQVTWLRSLLCSTAMISRGRPIAASSA